MRNNSGTGAKTRTLARIFIAVMAVCLALTAVPFLAPDSLPVAKAANVQLTGTSKEQINTALSGYAAGTVVDLTLGSDIDLTDNSDTVSYEITGIEIPKGITVNLYMNGKRILFAAKNGVWQLPLLRAIHNKGTLNIYSGSSPSSPNRANATVDASAITLVNKRIKMTAEVKYEYAYSRIEAIYNEGTVFIGKNVTVDIDNELVYVESNNPRCCSSATVTATGVQNISGASVTTDNAVFTIKGYAGGCNANTNLVGNDRISGSGLSFVYGINGGDVTVNGKTTFNITSDGNGKENSGATDYGRGFVTLVAYGVASAGKIVINGGEFQYSTSITQQNDGLRNGKLRVYEGGVAYQTGSTPEIRDGSVQSATAAVRDSSQKNLANLTEIREAPVTRFSTLPMSGEKIFDDGYHLNGCVVKDGTQVVTWPGGISAGQFKDESGNVYTSSMTDADGSHPTALVRGALDGSYRVHIIYRYWTDNNKSKLDTTVVGSDGNAGYSFMPLSDSTEIVKTKAEFSGIESQTNYTKSASAGIKYASGGEAYNSYFWHLKSISYATTTGWFSDVDFSSGKTVMKDFDGTTDKEVGASASPIYIYVDYVRKVPAKISMSIKSGTAVYTGKPILASVLGASVKNVMDSSDITADYNLDKNNNSLIDVGYSWTGTTAAGQEISGSGSLPTVVGTYTVTASFADNTVYGKDEKLYKNREAYSYTFTLNSTPSEVSRGTLPTSIDLTYGQKLSEVLKLSDFAADGVNGEKPSGTFSFKYSSDATEFKTVGSNTVTVVWTPADSRGNYKQTEFTVVYNVKKAQLTIRPLASTVVYGDSEFKKSFSSFFDGLTANDNNDDVKAQLEAVMSYTILRNGGWYPYKAGETPAGSYYVRATLTDTTVAVLSNYEYGYAFGETDNPEGILTVEKRPVTVVATAVSRPYDPNNGKVVVKFEITEGKLLADDVSVTNTEGDLDSKNAGLRYVSGIYKTTVQSLLTGGKSDNYELDVLLYNTGDNLTVEITKATPSVSVPSLGAVFYKRTQTLADIDLTDYNNGGTWQWTDKSVNPTVNAGSYSATFTPDDSANYETVTVSIPLTVNPTPVVISYKNEVSYGDNIPNITAYTYSAPNDPSFNIDSVTTTGNINVSTDYKVGSPASTTGYAVRISAPNFKDVSGNYTFTAQDGVITVKPRTIVFTVSDAIITYGENFATGSVKVTFDESRLVGDDTASDITSNKVEPSFNVTSKFDYLTNYGVGEYELTANASFTTSPNYDIKIVNGKLTVKKADLVIKAKSFSLTYGSSIPDNLSQQYELEGAKRGDTLASAVTAGEVNFSTDYYKGAPVNAEGYNFYIDISGATFRNYNVSVERGTVVVVKADPKITDYPKATLTYGDTLADAVFEGGTVDVAGTYVYDRADIMPSWQEAAWTIYSASFVPEDTVNYNTVKNLYVSLTVNKKEISGSLAVNGNPMLGSTLTVDVSGLDPASVGTYTFVWTVDGEKVGTGETLALNDETKFVGKTVTVTATATGYYTGSASVTTTKVAPTLTPVTEILTDGEFDKYFNSADLSLNATKTVTYDGKTQNIAVNLRSDVTAKAKVGAITVKYNGSTTAPSAAGTYSVTIDIATPDFGEITTKDGKTYDGDTVVYSPISNFKIGTLVIEKAPYDVIVCVDNKVYDGYTTATAKVVSESGAVTLTGGDKDDVKFGKASFVFSDANVATGKTVTYADASLAGAAAANYELKLTLQNNAKADITPRKLLVKADPISREYADGNYDVSVSFEINTASIAATDSLASVGINEAAASGRVNDFRAGTRNVTLQNVELTGSKKANYTLEITNSDSLTVQILKATPSYPIPEVADITYDAGRHLSAVSLGDSRWSWSQNVKNEVPAAGAHTYTAVFTPADTANYATVTRDVSFTVNKAPVTVKAASFDVTYGDIEPTYYTIVTGLTGSDTVKNLSGFVLLNCAYQTDSPVGTYTVTIDGRYESDNYTFDYTPGTVTVNPRTVYVTAEAVNREYEAGNVNVTVSFSALSNVRVGDEGNVYLKNASLTGTVANDTAGTKTVTYTVPELAGSAAQNYVLKLLNTNLTVEILKARLAGVVLPTSATVFYGSKLSTAKWTSAYEGTELGTFSMKDPMSTPKAVGTTSDVYKVIFTPFESANYATVEQYITLTVERAALNLEMSIAGVLTSGNKLYIVTNSIPEDAARYIVYNWYRVPSADADYKSTGKVVAYNTSEYTLTEDDVGFYIVAVAQNSSDSPYYISASCVSDSSVSQPKMSFWQKIMKWFYKLIASITAVFGRVR